MRLLAHCGAREDWYRIHSISRHAAYRTLSIVLPASACSLVDELTLPERVGAASWSTHQRALAKRRLRWLLSLLRHCLRCRFCKWIRAARRLRRQLTWLLLERPRRGRLEWRSAARLSERCRRKRRVLLPWRRRALCKWIGARGLCTDRRRHC